MSLYLPAAATGQPQRGFTLVELLVSMSILMLLAVVVFGLTSSISKIWKNTNTKIESFQGARAAFESMTRSLNQATTNTYWDYFDASDNPVVGSASIAKYARNSELHFISGPGDQLITSGQSWSNDGTTPSRPTHAMFFVAPTGFTTPGGSNNLQGLDRLLNACGYYIEFNSDRADRPLFMRSNNENVRYRYRLMQLTQPSDRLSIYDPEGAQNKGFAKYTNWFNDALQIPPRGAGSGITTPDSRPIADNVIALIIMPRRSTAESATPLAPEYVYDSRNTSGGTGIYGTTPPEVRKLHRHQLPPFVQVTLVALDETSAVRLANGAQAPDLVSREAVGGSYTGFSDATKYDADLKALEDSLASRNLIYRVFTTNVHIRGAKWSEN